MRQAVQTAAAHGRILVVNASTTRRRAICQLLAGGGYELLEAATTLEALSAIPLEGVDLILIDVATPGLGGIGFCKALRKAAATQMLPIFVLAEAQDSAAEVASIEAGADHFLAAPLNFRALLARIRSSLSRKAMIDTLDDPETVLFSLARSVQGRDEDLGQHCQRIALMSATMGAALQLSNPNILALERGGYLHDIGKISIPDRVLFKAGPLTPEEWDIMKSHAARGEAICRGIKSLTAVLPIIRNHHERWDGSGYPDGLAGHQIPLLARVLQLADIYDALTSARPYKQALGPDEALAIIRQEARKGWRDPDLVELFAELQPTFTPVEPEFSGFSLHALSTALDHQAGVAPPATNPEAIDAGAKTLDFLQQISIPVKAL